ncbi:MAG: (Fe-S)-binding protein [Chlorobia bacterium]|nr:(Fe-S)-binding protein [Fimbriimonadaceae bacterium]
MGIHVSQLTDLTTQCIRCGFCLESCPTFVLTGEETESPRGRIYLVRSAEEGQVQWQDAKPHLDKCLGCLACTTACPSGVKYGEILELARSKVGKSLPKKALLTGMTRPNLLRIQLKLGRLFPSKRIPALLSRLLSGQTPEVDKPQLPAKKSFPSLDESKLPPIRGEVFMLEGCAMRVLYPHVNEITRRMLRRVGFQVREIGQGCCGALHAHNGYLDEAKAMRSRLYSALSGDIPIIVNSAGCGSWLKDGDRSGWVFDASEFLLQEGLAEILAREGTGGLTRVTYHDACHLSHGQGIRSAPRELLKAIPGLELVELEESDMCCGSAGIYNIAQPKMARELLERKWKNIESTGATIVATGNPGCHAWIAQAAREHGQRVEVLHTLEVLERSFLRPRSTS